MTADAIFAVTESLRIKLDWAIRDDQAGADQVYVGPPVAADVEPRRLSLFLFHLQPNRDLRNAEHHVTPPPNGDQPRMAVDALPLDLRYLLSVFRRAGDGGAADADELNTLGRAIQALHAEPTLRGPGLDDQIVRVTPEPYPVEEMSRVWGLFPQASYRTSMVYLASPVFVSVDLEPAAPRVLERTLMDGPSTDPSDLLADRLRRGASS
jgi:hypothetical protein